MATLLIDVTRTLQRRARGLPATGVDRVEVTYIEAWLDAEEVRFIALVNRGWRFVPTALIRRLLAEPPARKVTVASLDDLNRSARQPGTVRRARALVGEGLHALWNRWVPPSRLESLRGVYLKASHERLDRTEAFEALQAAGLALAFFVHDVQPFEVPEFFTAGEYERHRARMQTVARTAAVVLVNSRDTATRFERSCREFGWREPPCRVLPLGIPPALEASAPPPLASPQPGHFVMLGTVQPRKNHALMLQIWRQIAERLGDEAAPRLVIIGRRGWLSEPVFRMLRRSPVLARHVLQAGALDDEAAFAVLAGARALLMPSFAEGYALPIAEALALGVPVIASDLPAHREVGGERVTYLDPLDGRGWMEAVLAFSEGSSTGPAIAGYRPPTWSEHLEALRSVLGELGGGTP